MTGPDEIVSDEIKVLNGAEKNNQSFVFIF